MNIHWLQHVPFEGLGSIESWAIDNGHRLTSTRLYDGNLLPNLGEIDWLIVMGGPMSVHDTAKYPWLIKEKELIKAAIDEEKIVLGICLGAQLIADALGARVFPGPEKEIGWYSIRGAGENGKTGIAGLIPDKLEVFHWHGETFELPAGAMRVASSALYENQAFVFRETVVGLQFHPEMTRNGVWDLIGNCGSEIAAAPHIQTAEMMLSGETRCNRTNKVMDRILDYLEKLVS